MCSQFDGTMPGPVYPDHTSHNKLCYFFHPKHHNQNMPKDAQWKAGISKAQEFGVFDLADRKSLSGPQGNLFGLLIHEGAILELGMFGEVIATFPVVRDKSPWHGFPHWPLARLRSDGGRDYPAPRTVLRKMEDASLINKGQRKRLERGRHI